MVVCCECGSWSQGWFGELDVFGGLVGGCLGGCDECLGCGAVVGYSGGAHRYLVGGMLISFSW